MNDLATVLKDQGKYEAAEEMYRGAMGMIQKVLGMEHLSTMTSMGNLASVLSRQGKYNEAEGMSRRALAGSEKALGMDHPDTLTSVSNLALVLQDQGKYNGAEDLPSECLVQRIAAGVRAPCPPLRLVQLNPFLVPLYGREVGYGAR
jgi:hypothetical protein